MERAPLAGATFDSAQYERIALQEDAREVELCTKRRFQSITEEFDDVHPVADMTPRERAKMLLDSKPFQVLMASCIMLNAAVIGGETDFPELEIWHLVENAFLLIFSSELLLRLFSSGVRNFFAPGEDQMWNLFDFGIVGLGVFDFVFNLLGGHSHSVEHHAGDSKKEGGGVSTLFRMIRLLRILRVFKIVRFLKQLYMIFFGFLEAIQAICLVTVLMFFVLYLCSVVMVRTYGRLAQGHPEANVLATQFKSIKTSMLSLFELMSNPGKLEIYEGLMEDYPILTLFLVAFVIFGSFGMIALLTGVISESMFEKNQTRVQELRQEREQKRDYLKQKCKELYGLVEKNPMGEAYPRDVAELIPYVREVFDKLEIEYMEHEMENIVSFCDTNGSGSLSENEFVSGILSLCDGVRAASLQEVYHLVSQIQSKVTGIDSLHNEVRQITRSAIPELHNKMLGMMHKLEALQQLGAKPESRPTSGNLPASTAVCATCHLREIKSSVVSTMDEHAELISKTSADIKAKINDLNANLRELCNRQEVLYGNVFTLPEAGKSAWSEIASPPVLSDVWSANFEDSTRGTLGPSSSSGQHEDDTHIIPCLLPLANGTAEDLRDHVLPSDQQDGQGLPMVSLPSDFHA